MIVADTNLVAYLLIDGDGTASARRVWERDPAWILPPLWRSEYLNVLATLVRAEILTDNTALDSWRRAARLFRGREREPRGEAVLGAALRYGLSAYDAHFVVVAEQAGVALVTSDAAILQACPGLAVEPREFAAAT